MLKLSFVYDKKSMIYSMCVCVRGLGWGVVWWMCKMFMEYVNFPQVSKVLQDTLAEYNNFSLFCFNSILERDISSYSNQGQQGQIIFNEPCYIFHGISKCQTLDMEHSNYQLEIFGLNHPGIEPGTFKTLSKCLTSLRLPVLVLQWQTASSLNVRGSVTMDT